MFIQVHYHNPFFFRALIFPVKENLWTDILAQLKLKL